jgi:uncharacterized protein (DUF1501 family)
MSSDKNFYLRSTRREFLRQASCAAVGTLALSATIRDLRLINSVIAQTGVSTGYKALVCLFLSGGNDANNWIVPTDNSTYADYASIRANLSLPQSSLLPLWADAAGTTAYTDLAGHSYGFHPSCPELQTLFREDKLAVMFNVGTLVRPTTRAQYLSNTRFYTPPQLFSHSDQVTQWQTSIPDAPPTTGWGGRVADLLDANANPAGNISMSVSLNGTNTFEIGNLISQYQVATTGAVVPSGNLMTGGGARVRALKDILGLNHSNLQRAAYADVVKNALAVGDALNVNIGPYLDPTDSPASYTAQSAGAPWRWNTGLPGIYSTAVQANGLGGFPNTALGAQLKMIARLIAARGPAAFNMNRQIFFCGVGGYDTHTSQVLVNGVNDPVNPNGAHYKLLDEASSCMFAFQRAMEQLGVSDKVTTFTASDFSRTLPTNSQGSDHGWGSHHLIMGGAVKGGQTYGKLPTFAINGPDDTGLGRWIPSLAVDQYSATLAKWFGVDSSNLANVFPNLSRFPTSDLGFML